MTHPNILLLYVDQHRWDALGANGNTHIHTPNLDRLAAEGHNFDHYFVQNPLCMPSRVSFLTGQYPSTLRITHMGVPVPDDTVTIGTIFGRNGYHCANIGKLHFLPHANRDHRTLHPAYGFDHLEISDEPGVYEDAYRAWVRRHAPDQLPHLSVGLPPATVTWYNEMGMDDPIHRERVARDDFTGAIRFAGDENYTHTAFVGTRTSQFIERQRGKRPWLCIAGFYSPHAPWVVPQRYLDLYDRDALPLPDYPAALDIERHKMGWTDDYLRETRHGYYAMISEVDEWVGRILTTLEQSGQRENTIIVYTSDHGEWLGDHLKFGKGYPGDDAAVRVPFIIQLPDNPDNNGQTHHHIIEAVDVLPTLLDCAGIQPPPHLQGRSFAGVLWDRPYKPRSSALVEFAGWKNVRTRTHRYLIEADGTEHVWDLERDPHEYRPIDAADMTTMLQHEMVRRLIENERPLPRTWAY